eukprot:1431500-Rhodomonas_salina.1
MRQVRPIPRNQRQISLLPVQTVRRKRGTAIDSATCLCRIVLRACYARRGTDMLSAYAVCGTAKAYGTSYLPTRCAVLRQHMAPRACYAMSGTEIAYGSLLHAHWRRYRPEAGTAILLRARYAMSGTDIAYAATRALCNIRY